MLSREFQGAWFRMPRAFQDLGALPEPRHTVRKYKTPFPHFEASALLTMVIVPSTFLVPSFFFPAGCTQSHRHGAEETFQKVPWAGLDG